MDFRTILLSSLIWTIAVSTAKRSTTLSTFYMYTDPERVGLQRGLKEFRTEEATATLPSDFSTKCGEYCHGDTLHMSTQYYANASSHGHIVSDIFPDSDAIIVSGVMDVQLSGHTGGLQICPKQTCTLAAQIPVDTSKYNESKAMLCMRIEEGRATGGCGTSGICLTGYNKSTGTATCESTMLGELFVLQYVSPFSLVPSDMVMIAMDKQGAKIKVTQKQVKRTLSFIGEYLVLRDVSDLMQGIKQDLAVYAHVDIEDVEITDIRQGSVTFDVVIHVPPDRSDEETAQLANVLLERPQEIFSDDFIDNFGVPTVLETPSTLSPSDKPKKKRFFKGIVKTITICLIITVLVVVIIVYEHKQDAKKEKSPLTAPPSQPVEAEIQIARG